MKLGLNVSARHSQKAESERPFGINPLSLARETAAGRELSDTLTGKLVAAFRSNRFSFTQLNPEVRTDRHSLRDTRA